MKRVLDLPVQFKVVSSRRAFSTLIEQRRKQLGLNQTELGRRLRVKQQQVSKWEKGETLPDSKRLTSLAKALEMDVNDLYAAHAAASEAEARQARRTSDETHGPTRAVLRPVRRTRPYVRRQPWHAQRSARHGREDPRTA